jgi:hypothetical protein
MKLKKKVDLLKNVSHSCDVLSVMNLDILNALLSDDQAK